jgi:hypothetical protein
MAAHASNFDVALSAALSANPNSYQVAMLPVFDACCVCACGVFWLFFAS